MGYESADRGLRDIMIGNVANRTNPFVHNLLCLFEILMTKGSEKFKKKTAAFYSNSDAYMRRTIHIVAAILLLLDKLLLQALISNTIVTIEIVLNLRSIRKGLWKKAED